MRHAFASNISDCVDQIDLFALTDAHLSPHSLNEVAFVECLLYFIHADKEENTPGVCYCVYKQMIRIFHLHEVKQ